MHYFLRNYKMNTKIHHFSIRLHVLGRTTQAQLPSFTFIALYSMVIVIRKFSRIQKIDRRIEFFFTIFITSQISILFESGLKKSSYVRCPFSEKISTERRGGIAIGKFRDWPGRRKMLKDVLLKKKKNKVT